MAKPKIKKGMGIQNWLYLLLILILFPVLVLQGYRYYNQYQEKQEEALSANLEMARAVAKSFESFVQDVVRQELAIGVAITSSTKITHSDINRLLETSRDYPAVRDFTWLNPEGIAIYSNNPAMMGINYSDRTYFRDIVGGREWVVGELLIAKTSGQPTFGISRGIRDDKGNLLGVIFAAILPDKLDAQLAIERGEGGAVSIVDRQGMLVYRYPAIETAWEERNWLTLYPEYEEVFKGKEISKTMFATYEGKERLVSVVPISSIGWAAGAGKRKEDVTGPIVSSLVRDAVLFLSVSLIAFLIAAALSRKITNPIGELRTYASSLGEGKGPKQVDVEKVPELQDLAESLNAMAEKVRERETALRESEELYRGVVQNTTAIILRVDPQGIIRFANERALQFFGYSAEELIGKHAVGTIVPHQESTGRDLAAMVDGIAENPDRYHTNANENIRKNGERVWMEWTNSGIYDTDGKLKEFLSVGIDATERKRAEEQIRRNQKTFADLVERSPFGTYIVDSQFRIAIMNASSQEGAFRNVRPVIGRPFDEAMRILWPEPVAAEIIGHFRHTLETGEPYYSPRFINPRHDVEIVESYEWELQRITLPDGQYGVICYYFDSTKLREAEAAVQQSEERLRFALESCQIGAWDISLEDHTAYRSLEHDRIFGYQELLPQWTLDDFLKHALPEYRAPVETMVREATAKKTGWTYECQIRRVDGEVRWIWFSGQHRTDNSGRSRVAGVVQDITKRKRMEEALLRSEEKFSKAFTMNPAAVVLVNLENATVVDVNRAFLDVFGFTREEVIGRSSYDLKIWPTPEDRVRRVKELVEKGLHNVEQLMVRKSGERFMTLVSAEHLLLSDESVILASFLDIEERKRAEEALRKSEERLRLAQQAARVGTFEFDLQNNRNVWTPELEALYGLQPGEFAQTVTAWTELIHPEDREDATQLAQQSLHTGGPTTGEWRVVWPDGSMHWLAGRWQVYKDASGRPLTMTGVNLDITDLKLAEEGLREAKESLEQKVQERTIDLLKLTEQLEGSRDALRSLASELFLSEERERKRIAAVLHDEICQTLAVVKMRIDMLQGALVDDGSKKTLGEAKEFLAQSIREARALMNDVGNPLLFDLGIRAACTSLAERLMTSHPIRIECDIPDSFKDLDHDVKVILYQLIRELLNNIVKHSGAGNARVSIRTDNGRIHTEVRDDGKGFEPQTLGAPTEEGGFGLFSIQERLKALNASLQIESAPGKGTVVKTTLPLGLAGRRTGLQG